MIIIEGERAGLVTKIMEVEAERAGISKRGQSSEGKTSKEVASTRDKKKQSSEEKIEKHRREDAEKPREGSNKKVKDTREDEKRSKTDVLEGVHAGSKKNQKSDEKIKRLSVRKKRAAEVEKRHSEDKQQKNELEKWMTR